MFGGGASSTATPLNPVLFALAIDPVLLDAMRSIGWAHPGGVDFQTFYLDDGLIAGRAPAVRCFLQALVAGFGDIGLSVSLETSEVVPPCATSPTFGPTDFPSSHRNASASFKLLCAAIGPSSWCDAPLRKVVTRNFFGYSTHFLTPRTLSASFGHAQDAQCTRTVRSHPVSRRRRSDLRTRTLAPRWDSSLAPNSQTTIYALLHSASHLVALAPGPLLLGSP